MTIGTVVLSQGWYCPTPTLNLGQGIAVMLRVSRGGQGGSNAEHPAMLETVSKTKELSKMPVAPLVRKHVSDLESGHVVLG